MRKLMYLFITVCLFTVSAQAQSDYKNAIGIRLGGSYFDVVSASYKTFLTEPGALELNVGFRTGIVGWRSLSAAASYQHHFEIPVPGLKWFIGGGVSAYNVFTDFYYGGFGLGVFPTAGVDYKFEKIPLNVSVDTRPTLYFVRDSYWNSFYFGGAASARYTF